ncbi:alpha/beta fold hydrolase [Cellulomonas carbonis]|uniref:Alpha/beta hydrolase n=1 Tax=Cellulomonas carbonis T26 TaxID=947969 RepID=A0A0A0BW89_9CELL|nr:alpha/beta hydrolase [Cellulomonas carbonis]KGM12653.1 alpha/beta hydrolase [Cellulomonas carbonis T26]GGC06339.1 alpha/beta hydrolase [Cellulomonas carbonis]
MHIPGFDHQRLPGADDVHLNVAVAGRGTPVVLLHGFPQTHLMWRHVAPALAERHTVICPDLRGYGDSDKPPADGVDTYFKRTMARDVVEVTRALGFERFAVVGHDRGALVALRTGLDHPDAVTHLGTLDVLPTLDMWDVLHGVQASVAWHLYLMAQPPGLPEAMIAAVADDFFAAFLDGWGADERAIPQDVRAAYLAASSAAVPSIVADYRASATIDLEHDRADRAEGRRLAMPVTVVQQDWGSVLGYDAAALWGAWATDLDHRTLDAGHFMAEQAPEQVLDVIASLLAR